MMNFLSKYLVIVKAVLSGNYFARRSSRTQSIVKNIGVGFTAKGLGFLISFLQIPITLSVLSKTDYGVWLTLFSAVSWVLFLDVGLASGLRNKLTEALSEGNTLKAKTYVSTTYLALTGIFSAVIVVFSLVSFFLPWSRLLNSPPSLDSQLVPVVYICCIATFANFVVAIIHIVFAAHQQTGKSNVILFIGQVAILIAILLIKYLKLNPPFFYTALAFSCTPLLINLVVSLFMYKGKFAAIAPTIHYFKRAYLNDILSIGVKFFVIQIAVLVIFTTDNFLLSHLFAPESVAYYNITYKYFSLIAIAFAIISEPLWSMYTDAYKCNDIAWINNNIKNLLKILGMLVVAVALMVSFSKPVFTLWVGKEMAPPLMLTLLLSVYFLQTIWNNIFVIPLNSIGKLDWQMYASIFAGIINVPLAILISKVLHNPSAIVLANICSLILGSVMSYKQYNKFFKK
jgi:O-antigen/teichoic acid export membrane protein